MKHLIVLILIACFASPAFAKKAKKKSAEKKTNRVTEAKFTGSTVHGKYALSPEAVVTVDQEKELISVVQPRENFDLQIKQSREDYK